MPDNRFDQNAAAANNRRLGQVRPHIDRLHQAAKQAVGDSADHLTINAAHEGAHQELSQAQRGFHSSNHEAAAAALRRANQHLVTLSEHSGSDDGSKAFTGIGNVESRISPEHRYPKAYRNRP